MAETEADVQHEIWKPLCSLCSLRLKTTLFYWKLELRTGNTCRLATLFARGRMLPVWKCCQLPMLPVSNGDFDLLLSPTRFPFGGADGAAPSPSYFLLLPSYFARERTLTPFPEFDVDMRRWNGENGGGGMVVPPQRNLCHEIRHPILLFRRSRGVGPRVRPRRGRPGLGRFHGIRVLSSFPLK